MDLNDENSMSEHLNLQDWHDKVGWDSQFLSFVRRKQVYSDKIWIVCMAFSCCVAGCRFARMHQARPGISVRTECHVMHTCVLLSKL
jgi:hypothetical protein